ncbi:hypothetical protein HY214_01525 [Candidatus Roizmanbacteria bacterium]|nr:hypothetical protein [Candidatus Roizmanbacteria bacterium]
MLRSIQFYLISTSVFFAIILFLPFLKDSYSLPKLFILRFVGFGTLILEFFIVWRVRANYRFFRSDFVLLIITLAYFLVFLGSTQKNISFYGLYTQEGLDVFSVLSYISIAFVYTRFTKKQKKYLRLYIVGATLLSSGYVIYKSQTLHLRPGGLEGQPILTAGIIGYGIVTLFSLCLELTKKRLKPVFLLIFTLTVYAVALSALDSSIVWLSLGASMVFSIGQYLVTLKKTLINKPAIIVGLLILCLLLFRSILLKEQFSLTQRSSQMSSALTMIRRETLPNFRYLAVGHGQNTSGLYFKKYRSPSQNNTPEWFWQLSRIQNQPLEFLFTGGLLFAGIWYFLTVTVIYDVFKRNEIGQMLTAAYLIIWQLFYYLLPVLFIGVLFLIVDTYNANRLSSLKSDRRLSSFFAAILLVLASYLFYKNIVNFIAEIYYSHDKYEQAVRLNPTNTQYLALLNSVRIAKIENCLNKLIPKSTPDCNLDVLFLSAETIAKQAIAANNRGAENYYLLSVTDFRWLLWKKDDLRLQLAVSEAINAAINLDPTNPVYLDSLGQLYLEEKQYNKAQKEFIRTLKMKADYIPSYRHLKELYLQTGDERVNGIEKKLRDLGAA